MYWLARLSLACAVACACVGAPRSEPIAPSVLILYQSGAGLQAYVDISEAFRGTIHRSSKSFVAVYEEKWSTQVEWGRAQQALRTHGFLSETGARIGRSVTEGTAGFIEGLNDQRCSRDFIPATGARRQAIRGGLHA